MWRRQKNREEPLFQIAVHNTWPRTKTKKVTIIQHSCIQEKRDAAHHPPTQRTQVDSYQISYNSTAMLYVLLIESLTMVAQLSIPHLRTTTSTTHEKREPSRIPVAEICIHRIAYSRYSSCRKKRLLFSISSPPREKNRLENIIRKPKNLRNGSKAQIDSYGYLEQILCRFWTCIIPKKINKTEKSKNWRSYDRSNNLRDILPAPHYASVQWYKPQWLRKSRAQSLSEEPLWRHQSVWLLVKG